MANVRDRISEIQRMLGVRAVTAVPLGSANSSGAAGPLSFQRALQQARGGSGQASGSSGSLPPVDVSDAMRAAGNGRLPDSMLVPIGQGGHRLGPRAAEAFGRLNAAARRDGVAIRVTSSYRPYDEQVATADRVGLYGQGGWAAVPGTSNHGWGLAVDLDLDERAQAWMRTNAERFGFFEDVPDEAWHWTFRA